MVSIIDTILLIGLFGFIFYGFFFGLIRTFGSLLGVVVGAILASRFYLVISDWADPLFFGYANLGKVMVFIFLFAIINRVVGFGFYLIDRAYNILTLIPFLKTINRLGGAILGLLVGSLSIGLILFVISKYSLIDHWFGRWLIDSQLAPYLLKFTHILMPLLPEMLKRLEGLI